MKQISALNSRARELVKYTPLQYMIDAYCENTKLGKVFVDDEDNPNSCIISIKHLLFFGGNVTQDCLRFLQDEILTDVIRDGKHVFYIFYPDEAWKNELIPLFPDNHNEYERSLHIWNGKMMDKPQYYENIVQVTSELINSTVNNLEMIINEVCSTGTYENMEDYQMRGIGYTTVINNTVCGFCTSEYPSKSAIAIGIEVLEEYQKLGYAKSMAKEFLYKANQRGLTVYWESWKYNKPSVNTALACNFEKVADYPILFVKL